MNVWCVRAAKAFIEGGCVAIGWMSAVNLCNATSKEDLYLAYKQAHPKDTSNLVIGQQVGQISRFLFDIQPGDFV